MAGSEDKGSKASSDQSSASTSSAKDRIAQVKDHLDNGTGTNQPANPSRRRLRKKKSRDEPPADWSDVLGQLKTLRSMAKTPDPSHKGYSRQKASGKLWVRERVDKLLDPGSFREVGSVSGEVKWKALSNNKEEPASYIPSNNVQGFGKLRGRDVLFTADDFTLRAGHADGALMAKTVYMEELAIALKLPIIKLVDGSSGGGSVSTIKQMGWSYIPPLPSFDAVMKQLNLGIPNLGAVVGPAIGLGAARVVSCHFSVMAADIGALFNAGPKVVSGATFEEDLSFTDLGGPAVHCTNGTIDNLAANEDECFEQLRAVLSYLPNIGTQIPPTLPCSDPADRQCPNLRSVIPRKRTRMYNPYTIITSTLDASSFFEIGTHWARTVICGLARLNGRPVGIVANNPESSTAGALDAQGSQKLLRHLKFLDIFNLPLLQFVDVPGYAVGTVAERSATMRWGVELAKAYYGTTMPIFSVVTRRVYGVAGGVMLDCRSPRMRVAWPSGEWGSLPLDGGIEAGHAGELGKIGKEKGKEAAKERYKELEDMYWRLMSPIRTANAFGVEEIIDPARTREIVCQWTEHVYSHILPERIQERVAGKLQPKFLIRPDLVFYGDRLNVRHVQNLLTAIPEDDSLRIHKTKARRQRAALVFDLWEDEQAERNHTTFEATSNNETALNRESARESAVGTTPSPLSTPLSQNQTAQAGGINFRTFRDNTLDNTLVVDEDVEDTADAMSDDNNSLPDPDGDTKMPDADDPLADVMAVHLHIGGIDHYNGNTRNHTFNHRIDDNQGPPQCSSTGEDQLDDSLTSNIVQLRLIRAVLAQMDSRRQSRTPSSIRRGTEEEPEEELEEDLEEELSADHPSPGLHHPAAEPPSPTRQPNRKRGVAQVEPSCSPSIVPKHRQKITHVTEPAPVPELDLDSAPIQIEDPSDDASIDASIGRVGADEADDQSHDNHEQDDDEEVPEEEHDNTGIVEEEWRDDSDGDDYDPEAEVDDDDDLDIDDDIDDTAPLPTRTCKTDNKAATTPDSSDVIIDHLSSEFSIPRNDLSTLVNGTNPCGPYEIDLASHDLKYFFPDGRFDQNIIDAYLSVFKILFFPNVQCLSAEEGRTIWTEAYMHNVFLEARTQKLRSLINPEDTRKVLIPVAKSGREVTVELVISSRALLSSRVAATILRAFREVVEFTFVGKGVTETNMNTDALISATRLSCCSSRRRQCSGAGHTQTTAMSKSDGSMCSDG
ncbi:hypothetical protein MBLNU457_7364t2 [Dothideomycetes sp. NU457]